VASLQIYSALLNCYSPIIRIFFGSTEQLTDTRAALLVLAWRTPCRKQGTGQQHAWSASWSDNHTLQKGPCRLVV
jgi:hypothetical protein